MFRFRTRVISGENPADEPRIEKWLDILTEDQIYIPLGYWENSRFYLVESMIEPERAIHYVTKWKDLITYDEDSTFFELHSA